MIPYPHTWIPFYFENSGSPYFEDPRCVPMLCKAGCGMFQFVYGNKCLSCTMCVSTVLTQHSSSGSLTSYIMGNACVLITQTNLYKLQLFYL